MEWEVRGLRGCSMLWGPCWSPHSAITAAEGEGLGGGPRGAGILGSQPPSGDGERREKRWDYGNGIQ